MKMLCLNIKKIQQQFKIYHKFNLLNNNSQSEKTSYKLIFQKFKSKHKETSDDCQFKIVTQGAIKQTQSPHYVTVITTQLQNGLKLMLSSNWYIKYVKASKKLCTCESNQLIILNSNWCHCIKTKQIMIYLLILKLINPKIEKPSIRFEQYDMY